MAAQELAATKRAGEQITSLTGAMEKIRSRTDITAKGLAGIGTAAIGGIGYAELADVYPFGGPDWAPYVLGTGVVLMVISVVVGFRRFYGAGQTIATTPDPESTIARNDFDEFEKALVRDHYGRMAELNGVSSLMAYQARGHRFESIADRGGEDDSTLLRARADQILTEVSLTQARLGAFILRRRANRAFFRWQTPLCIFLFLVGWYATALSADAMESERTDQVEALKTCAEVRKADAALKLPRICAGVTTKKDEKDPTVGDTNAAALAALGTSLGACLEQAATAKEDDGVCAPLDRALAAARNEGAGS